MKALVYAGPRKVKIEEVPDPKIERPTDALVRITTTNICGSDLHMYEGRTSVEKGKVLGHENRLHMGSGQANVKAHNRELRDLIHAGRAKPSFVISHRLGLDAAPDAYAHFDARDQGWTKVVLKVAA